MVVLKENCCRFCAKVFCCSDCRESHESSKHPKLKCPLCVRDILPFNPKDDKKSDLFCHIVFNHLPLHCKLCGDKYTNNKELTDAQSCRWLAKQRALKELQLAGKESNSSPTLPPTSSFAKLAIICEEKLPRTPEFAVVGSEGPKKPLHVTDPSSLTRLKQEHLDSPPELVRHTSTPVPGALLLPGPKPTASGALPQFMLKTPSSAELKHPFDSTASTVSTGSRTGSDTESKYYTGLTSTGSRTGSDTESRYYSGLTSTGSRTGSDTDSRYYTGLTSIADSRFEREKETEADPSPWNTPGLRKPQQQQQQPGSNPGSAEASRRIERSILKSEAWSRVNDSSRGDSIEKRVRFSDQCRAPADAAGMETSAYFADNDIFFEARESLDEEAAGAARVEAKEAPRAEADEGRCSPSSTVDCCNGDKNKVLKVEEGKAQNSPDSSTDEKENNKPTSTTSNSSSRVLMMLLVEKTDSKGLSSLDLAPLIDSGLKKLEETVASVNNNSKIVKGSHVNPADSSGGCASSTRRLSQVASFSRTVDGSVSEDGGKGVARATIKDSFVSISDRIECYTSTPARQAPEAAADQPDKALVASPKSDGIFSVMARVVRNALQKLPAVASRNLSREPVPHTDHTASESSLSATEVLSIGSRSSSSVVAGGGGASCGLAASQAIQLSSKRPRDRLDSGEEPATSRDSPGSTGSGSSNHQVVLSPVAKRPRGWYRIRAREPIARMRQITSPRGASREIQRFQQGSLTVGDTLLPLPSRAHQHQSTQTEN